MKNKINIVIPAAGLGTRMRPLSNGLSKTLIPLNGKPILAWIFDSITKLNAEIESIIIVTNDSGDIQRFVNTIYADTPILSKIQCVQQNKAYNGPGGAILSAVPYTNKDCGYLIWLSDTICTYQNFVFDSNSFVATAKVDINTSNRWCIPVCNSYDNGITFFDKPEREMFPASDDTVDALIGVYYLPSYNDALNIENDAYQNCSEEIQISSVLSLYRNIESNNSILRKKPVTKLIDVGDTWYDCGELDSFYDSKARLMNKLCRTQSSLTVDAAQGTVTKTADEFDSIIKLKLEFQWFNSRKENQLLYIPKIIKELKNGYVMELAPGNALSDMFIYENVPVNVWKTLLKRVIDVYHTQFAFIKPENIKNLLVIPEQCKDMFQDTCVFPDCTTDSDSITNEFYVTRTCMRLINNSKFYQSLGVKYNLQDFINYITEFADEHAKHYKSQYLKFCETKCEEDYPKNIISLDSNKAANIHGDFHLGNILFDSLTNKITFLDPRGGSMSCNSVDTYYDMAKLYHDLYCGYMLIMQNIYTEIDGKIVFPVYYQQMMDELVTYLDDYLYNTYNYNPVLIKKLAVIQILTCIPFHKDNPTRCKAFLLRATNFINSNKYC